MEIVTKDNYQLIITLLFVIAFVGWVVVGFMVGRAQGANKALENVRGDIVGLNTVENTLFAKLQPSQIDMLRGGGMGLLALMGALPMIDKEAIARSKDILDVLTDGRPNMPLVDTTTTIASGARATAGDGL